jgi:hypothetical protein
MLGVPAENLRKPFDLQRRALDAAIAEVNRFAEFRCDRGEAPMHDRRVVLITFSKKTPAEANAAITAAAAFRAAPSFQRPRLPKERAALRKQLEAELQVDLPLARDPEVLLFGVRE